MRKLFFENKNVQLIIFLKSVVIFHQYTDVAYLGPGLSLEFWMCGRKNFLPIAFFDIPRK